MTQKLVHKLGHVCIHILTLTWIQYKLPINFMSSWFFNLRHTCAQDVTYRTFTISNHWIHSIYIVLFNATWTMYILALLFTFYFQEQFKITCHFEISVFNMLFLLSSILLFSPITDPIIICIFALIYHSIFSRRMQ